MRDVGADVRGTRGDGQGHGSGGGGGGCAVPGSSDPLPTATTGGAAGSAMSPPAAPIPVPAATPVAAARSFAHEGKPAAAPARAKSSGFAGDI